MKAKDFLNQYYNAKRKTSLLDRELNLLKETEGDIRATDYGRIIVDGTKNADVIGDLVARIGDLEVRLLRAVEERTALMVDVLSVINRVEDAVVQEVLMLRYVECLPWESIADTLHYTTRHVHRLRLEGYEEVEKILKEDKWKTN